MSAIDGFEFDDDVIEHIHDAVTRLCEVGRSAGATEAEISGVVRVFLCEFADEFPHLARPLERTLH